jgi:serine/threonine protein phosphatase PrpC
MDETMNALLQHPLDDTEIAPPPTRSNAFALNSYGISHRGQVRESNEDHFLVAELGRMLTVHQTNLPQARAKRSSHRGYVLLVADGMGGANAGEVASGLTVEIIEEFLLNTLKRFSNLQAGEERNAMNELQNALFRADARIFEEIGKHPEWHGMGTTLTLAFVVNRRLFVAHAGDSRCYLYSKGLLQQLTQDHTVTAELLRRGVLLPDNGKTHPYRHVVTNILGGNAPGVEVDCQCCNLHSQDKILLCSDGLTEMVRDDEIEEILAIESEPRNACARLVDEANKRGGKDNITVIVAHVKS